MTTSGDFFASPLIASLVDDAFERVSIDPENLVARHAQSARRSLNFMLVDWMNMEDRPNFIERQTEALSANDAYFDAPAGTLDVLLINVQRDDAEIPLDIITRDEWMKIPDKTVVGRPDRVFIEKLNAGVRVHLWPVEESDSTDTIIYYRLRVQEDVGTATNTVESLVQYTEAICAGLAARLAEKYAPDREDKLTLKADRALERASQATRQRGDVRIGFGKSRGVRW